MPDVDAPTGWPPVTCGTSRRRPGRRRAPPRAAARAVRRLVAASSASRRRLVEVDVARPGASCRTTSSRHDAQQQLVVGAVRRRRGCARSRESISSMSRGGALADLLHQRDRGPVDRARSGTSAGAGRTRPAGSDAPPSGPTDADEHPAQAAAAVVQRRLEQRLADALALAAPAGRRTSPGTTSARGVNDVAKPTIPVSSSATQQPPGSVREEVAGALDPDRAPGRSARRSGSGQARGEGPRCRARRTPRR